MHFGTKEKRAQGIPIPRTGMTLDTRSTTPHRLLICDRNHEPKGRLLHYSLDGEFIEEVVTGLACRRLWPFKVITFLFPTCTAGLSLLDKNNTIMAVLGHNPDPAKGKSFNIPKPVDRRHLQREPRIILDKAGNLYVQDWNVLGRIMKLVRVASREFKRVSASRYSMCHRFIVEGRRVGAEFATSTQQKRDAPPKRTIASRRFGNRTNAFRAAIGRHTWLYYHRPVVLTSTGVRYWTV